MKTSLFLLSTAAGFRSFLVLALTGLAILLTGCDSGVITVK